MPNPKAWKHKDPKAPKFPDDFEVVQRATLQKTDLHENNNKYYGLELHKAPGSFRVFTHYGRTDDLTRNPDAGTKESRFFTSLGDAQREYNRLFKAKTSSRKGYVEVHLASSNIGSHKAKGTSSGEVDEKTAAKIEPKNDKPKSVKKPPVCPPGVLKLVGLIYNEATTALTNTVQAKITAKGIETPLGVLTMGQIDRGEEILKEIFEAVKASKSAKTLQTLSSQFYTAIPHKLGRTKDAIAASVINAPNKVAEKEETLQLMRDMLTVDGEEHSVLASDSMGERYKALGCSIQALDSGSQKYKEWHDFTMNSRRRPRSMKIQNIYAITRPGEEEAWDNIGNVKNMFHGSRIKNWVGLLTRGVLMPKLVVAMGVNRTDGGWLGNGIYFGDSACTSIYYTSPGRGGRRIMTIHPVALGKIKEFKKITYGMNEPPKGFDSCHGNPEGGSEFDDHEFCIYKQNRQMMKVLVEFMA